MKFAKRCDYGNIQGKHSYSYSTSDDLHYTFSSIVLSGPEDRNFHIPILFYLFNPG